MSDDTGTGGTVTEQMFYCPTCVEWVAETAISKAFGVEAGKLEHRVARHDPQVAAFLSVAAPIAGEPRVEGKSAVSARPGLDEVVAGCSRCGMRRAEQVTEARPAWRGTGRLGALYQTWPTTICTARGCQVQCDRPSCRTAGTILLA